MNLEEIRLHVIRMPLKTPFVTHLETVRDREAIILEVIDQNGLKGYGEVVAFSSPWYTEETVKTCLHMLNDFLIPLLKANPIKHPKELTALFSGIRRNNMAKAGLDMALWDLYAKKANVSLSKLFGGTLQQIPSGVVVGTDSIEKAKEQISEYLQNGYKRVKVKIHPSNDFEVLSEIRKAFPNLQLMADANSAYTLEDVTLLQRLDEFDLMMIEQPLAVDDIIDHATLQSQLRTPICLDESINSFEDARRAVELGSCQVINIKIGRVGGITEALRIHDYCLQKGISVWCGGMIEFGISRAHNIALASLPGFTIPGDISASSRYWEKDIIYPEVEVDNGTIAVTTSPGIGYELDMQRLKEVTVEEHVYIM